MPRDGNGAYSLPAGNPVQTETVASSTVHNDTMTDLATAITASLAKDGQTAATANLPMGGNKHTNVADASARNHYAAAGQIQDGDLLTLGSVSGTDTIAGSLTPAITAYVAGMMLVVKPANTNTGAATVNVNGAGAKAIVKFGATALVAGDLVQNIAALIVYDGVSFQLLNPQTGHIADDYVTNARLANMSQATVKGRASGAGTGDPTDLTAAQLIAIIATADGAGSGLDADTLDGSSSAAFATASHNHSASELTSGTIPDARVAASNVTQHEAALAINASQVVSTFANNNSSFSVASSMAGDIREIDSASAVTITVGSNCLGGTGVAALFIRRGSGSVTFSASGTTIRTKGGLAIAIEDGAAALIQLSTTEFQLIGDL